MKKTVARTIALTLAAILMLAFLSGCSDAGKFVGSWEHTETAFGVSVTTTYTFEKDGTGKLSTMLGISADYTYKVEGGKLTLVTTVLGSSSTTVYTYKFSGDTLTITDDSGDTVLTKVK